MLFGYKKFADSDDEISSSCRNVEQPGNSCTIVQIGNLQRYDKSLLYFWTLTLGSDFDRKV